MLPCPPLPIPAPSPYLPAMNLRISLLILLALAIFPALSCAADSERPDLAKHFEERGLVGTFVVQGPEGLVRVNAGRAAQGFRPASTFKIVNALVALENGVVHDTGHVLRWDGVKREVPMWNSDLTMNEAFRASAVWYFVELGKMNGRERLAGAMRESGYGNADASGSDQFWLDGPLRISADGQVAFLSRLLAGKTPFSARYRGLVARMMLLEQASAENGPCEPWALFGKTGLALKGGGEGDGVAGSPASRPVGWLVGWAERDGEQFPYALNISPARPLAEGESPGPEFARARLELVKLFLKELGLLP